MGRGVCRDWFFHNRYRHRPDELAMAGEMDPADVLAGPCSRLGHYFAHVFDEACLLGNAIYRAKNHGNGRHPLPSCVGNHIYPADSGDHYRLVALRFAQENRTTCARCFWFLKRLNSF